jgi:hypothetical protein
VALIGAVPAGAAILPTRNANFLAQDIGAPSTSATPSPYSFDTIPPGSGGVEPHGDGLTGAPAFDPDLGILPGFPRGGGTFAILTTGDASLADDPNQNQGDGVNLLGGNVRGNSDFDVSVLRLKLPVSAADTCLSFEFRFLSEEYPELVNGAFNDTFIAELRNSNWTTSGSTITAPNNFAGDASGAPITIDATGDAAVAPYRAVATTYDAATRVLRASAPLTPADQSAGSVDLLLSIFDHGDALLDSAVFVDNLVLDNRSTCIAGTQILDATDPETSAGEPKVKAARSSRADDANASKKKKKKKPKVTIPFSSSEPNSTFYCRFAKLGNSAASAYVPCGSPFKATVKPKKKYQFDVVAVDAAGNPDPQPVSITFKAKVKKNKH